MANARELLNRKKSVQNTGKITRTMELVASAKLKKAQDAAAAAEPYAGGLQDLMRHLAAASDESGIVHPLMEQREVKKVAILVACSDRGLCGAFNSNLVRLALEEADKHRDLGREVTMIALARKASSTLRFFGAKVDKAYDGLVEQPRYDSAEEVVAPLMSRFQVGAFDQVQIVYSHFATRARQYPKAETILPAGTVEADAEAEADVRHTEYIFHPDDPAALLAAMVPQAVRTVFFSCLLQTSAGEHAARRIAMKNASDAASDIVKAINSRYNRARQGKITQEIAEIVGAVEAMK